MDGGIRTDTPAITPTILRLIAEIDEFKGAWKAIGRISPERLTALRRIAKIRTDAPDWQPWLTLFLNALQQQKARLEKKMERERLVLGDLPELSVQILNTAAYPG